mgnify:CR=1 FL=1
MRVCEAPCRLKHLLRRVGALEVGAAVLGAEDVDRDVEGERLRGGGEGGEVEVEGEVEEVVAEVVMMGAALTIIAQS